jgi:ATP-dependent DNA helicase RecG
VVVDFCRVIGGEAASRETLLDAPIRWPRPSRLRAELDLPARLQEPADRLGLRTLGDLVEYLPLAHESRAHRPVKQLRAGEEAVIDVELRSISLRPTRRRNLRIVEALVRDSSGSIKAVWFNQPWLAKQLEPGARLRLFGKFKGGALQVREHTLVSGGAAQGDPEAGSVSIYPATEGLKSQRIRELVEDHRGSEVEVLDVLPGRLLAREGLVSRADALAEMHFPRDPVGGEVGRRRLAFEELLKQQLALQLRRSRRAEGLRSLELAAQETIVARWRERLPFELTDDQLAAIKTIDRELATEVPMQRLLMGEVGSGKTVVALSAMLRAAENGAQAALMAPTETLAEQHFATLDAMLPDVPLALLTGSTPAARRKELLARLESGELQLIVGTHALIEDPVVFRRLALVVVDEQHRFGVRQRAALDAKAPGDALPHVLHMTATPIPRTLALASYGDLDVTMIKQLPRGRKPISTRVVGDAQRATAYDAVRAELRAGRQAYVVCPLVSESEVLQARAATVEAEKLAAGELSDFSVGLIHGQLTSAEKGAAMREFADGNTDVLVATSVIEVGIDVPNASVMLIEDADRYGISQLHQLRGRVGRGEHPSICLLFGNPASRRLRAVAAERDGFKLAQVDLELRGAGEELGTRQSGLPRFKVAVLPEDTALLDRANAAARQLLSLDPGLTDDDHVLLRDSVVASYGDEIDPIPA